jgi:hypothetical protein
LLRAGGVERSEPMTTNTQMAEPVEAAVLDPTYIGSTRGDFGTIPRAISNETELTSQV